ncbi:MAG: c-type cytochrome [Pseudomonadota bacterium]|uniref:c-type cytochrome n=1 Tax=Thermithiobacillus tepidarius TaxID=929 RepID=UPI00040BC6BA|nr:c-type cytochrome [Thermithiobacillus tepidarius]
MKQSDCFSCHSVDQKMVGPAYAWVAYKYKGQKDADVKLAQKIKAGGAGNWNALTGGVPMPPHPQLTDAQAKAMADWVLKQKPVEPPKA